MENEKISNPNLADSDDKNVNSSDLPVDSSADAVQAEMLKQLKELTSQVNDLKIKVASESSVTNPDQIAADSGKETAEKPPAKKKKFAWLSELLFYIALLAVIVAAFFIRSNADGRPILIGGYSAFVVQTGSMQAEIPKGSLVVTKQVDANTLNVGDDITFMANQTTTITHRIIGITENFNESGQRAFETQGIMNKNPDGNPVPAANVVGKVVFHSEIIGLMAGFVGNNWPILLFIVLIIVALFFVLKKINQ